MEEKETQNAQNIPSQETTETQREPNKRRFRPRNNQQGEEKQAQNGQHRHNQRFSKKSQNSTQGDQKFRNKNMIIYYGNSERKIRQSTKDCNIDLGG